MEVAKIAHPTTQDGWIGRERGERALRGGGYRIDETSAEPTPAAR